MKFKIKRIISSVWTAGLEVEKGLDGTPPQVALSDCVFLPNISKYSSFLSQPVYGVVSILTD
jgi:hypothetical protein